MHSLCSVIGFMPLLAHVPEVIFWYGAADEPVCMHAWAECIPCVCVPCFCVCMRPYMRACVLCVSACVRVWG